MIIHKLFCKMKVIYMSGFPKIATHAYEFNDFCIPNPVKKARRANREL